MRKSVLVIDDQDSMRGIICQMLKDKGYQVSNASNGEEGLAIFKKNPQSYDLVLADVNMPKIDGFELLKIIKSSFPNKPVILLTGVDENVAKVVGEEYKADGIIKKPFQVEDALKTIEKISNQNPLAKQTLN